MKILLVILVMLLGHLIMSLIEEIYERFVLKKKIVRVRVDSDDYSRLVIYSKCHDFYVDDFIDGCVSVGISELFDNAERDSSDGFISLLDEAYYGHSGDEDNE